ncbi:MAG: DUF4488 domain-containing protein [Bacteroidaceae bacterium]
MKKKLFVLLLMCVSGYAYAQKETPKLQGIWQMCQPYEEVGVMKMRMHPFLKMLFSDGRFTNLMMEQGGKLSVITAHGTFRQTSDSTYVEHIDNSISDPAITGKDNPLVFRFKGADLLVISYVSTTGAKLWELWKRLKMKIE